MRLSSFCALSLIVLSTGCAEILGFDEYKEGQGLTGATTTASGGGGGANTGASGGGGSGASGAGGNTGVTSSSEGGSGGLAAGCSPENPCPVAPEPQCGAIVCEGGMCVPYWESAGKPLAVQEPGDCKEIQCDGNGGTVAVDATDPVVDSNPCMIQSCNAGIPLATPVDGGVACGGGVCDGNGSCVGCVVASGCPGVDDECKTRTCTANTCGFVYTPNGAPLSSQTSGNCQQKGTETSSRWRTTPMYPPTTGTSARARHAAVVRPCILPNRSGHLATRAETSATDPARASTRMDFPARLRASA